jgi:hypothetical protein
VKDLQTLDAELPRLHKNLFFKLQPADFHGAMTALEHEVPHLADEEIVMRLTQIVATVGDPHTEVEWYDPILGLHSYPVWLYSFSDGVFVIAADERYQRAIGSRVLGIAGTSIEKVEADVGKLIAHENPSRLKARIHHFLETPEALKAFGIIRSIGPTQFNLRSPGGEEFNLEVEPIAGSEAIHWVQFWEAKKVPGPLYLGRRGEAYWFNELPDSRTLYLQFNACVDRADLPLSEFTNQVFAFVDAHPVDRFVVDMRWNGGGNSEVIWPLIRGLEKRPSLNRKGRLFVIIGRFTFSSAVNDAIYFRDHTQALFVGEPTGGKPNSYGEVRQLELPYSRVRISYSTKFFHPINGSDPPSFEPDISVTVSSKQYFAGEDPALATALGYR